MKIQNYLLPNFLQLLPYLSNNSLGQFSFQMNMNVTNLSNENLVKPDIFGDAHEYMLAEFASETKKKGGQFYTPHEIVSLLVQLTKPKEGMRICDPTGGSVGMLIQSWSYVSSRLRCS